MAEYLIFVLAENPTTGQIFEHSWVLGNKSYLGMRDARLHKKLDASIAAKQWCESRDLKLLDYDGPFWQVDLLTFLFPRKPRWDVHPPPLVPYDKWAQRQRYRDK